MPSWRDPFRMALPPALVALAVTLLRLAGELRGWSEAWFSRATSGLVPTGAVSWLVGITWLVLPFGAWLAWRLLRSGEGPPSTGRAVLVQELPFWTAYLALAFIPQLVFWVAFTIVVGMLAGTLVVTLGARRGEERG